MVASLIDYPMPREYPLTVISSAEEFVANWEDFFDKEKISVVIGGVPEEIGWRGVQIADGKIWFNNGKITAINFRTADFDKKFTEAKNNEARSLYESARGYKNVPIRCATSKKIIRIQEHENDFRYFVWQKGANLSEKPELSLKGEQVFDGSGGNSRYIFENNGYTYELDHPVLCEDGGCIKSLAVFKAENELSRQACE